MNRSLIVAAILIFLAIVIDHNKKCRSGRERFEDSDIKNNLTLEVGHRYMLYHNRRWLIGSGRVVKSPENTAFRVSNGVHEMYGRVPKNGIVENLPAYVGGFPSTDSYKLIFESNRPVYLHVEHGQTINTEILSKHTSCLTRHPGNTEYCGNEFAQIQ